MRTGWSCAYINTLCWQSATTPLPMEHNPRRVFERLFGDLQSTDAREQRASFRRNRSILDSISDAHGRSGAELGPADRAKLPSTPLHPGHRAPHRGGRATELERAAVGRAAGGIPATYQEHAKLMADLQVLAFQADITRVITFMMGREKTNRPFPEIGIADAHHPLTHHAGNQAKIDKVIQIETLQSELFAYYVEKLQATADGDGSLLDHSIVTFGSAISDGNSHDFRNLPLLTFGAGDGRIKGGRHLKYPKETPMTNMYLAVLDRLGLPVEQFGDSTGKLDLLSV